MPVYQEELYFITHEFTKEQVVAVQDYLGNHEPVCCTSDWWDSELTLTGFDTEDSAEEFYNKILEAVE